MKRAIKADRGVKQCRQQGSRRDQEEGGGAGPSTEPRRDQEEGGGAGPSTEPRRDPEQGGGAELRKLDIPLLQFFLNSYSTDIVFVTAPPSC